MPTSLAVLTHVHSHVHIMASFTVFIFTVYNSLGNTSMKNGGRYTFSVFLCLYRECADMTDVGRDV